MRSIFKAFPFLLVALWIIGGTALVFHMTKSMEAEEGIFASNKETLVKDGEFEIVLSKPIKYAPRQAETTFTKEINDALVTLADYLIEAPTKRLLITGYYTLEEEKVSDTKGVGRMRAEHLKNHLIALGADPGTIFTNSELNKSIDENARSFKGAAFAIIDEENKKINTNPLLEANEGSLISYTTFILPYYTTQFDELHLLNEELEGYIERVLEHPEMAIAIETGESNIQAENLLELLVTYVKDMTRGANVPVVKQFSPDASVSDRDKQNIKIDIGIKRFQNNLEL